jgi:hypothetical protein
MQELSVIIRQKQYAKEATNKRLLSDVCTCIIIRSDACLATKTQQLYLYSSHV